MCKICGDIPLYTVNLTKFKMFIQNIIAVFFRNTSYYSSYFFLKKAYSKMDF